MFIPRKCHHTNLLNELQQQRNKGLTDITLFLQNGVSLNAHKCVLSASSKYFEEIITANDATKLEIELDVLVPDIAECLIDFCYTGKINFAAAKNRNIDDLIYGISVLEMKYLEQAELLSFYTNFIVPLSIAPKSSNGSVAESISENENNENFPSLTSFSQNELKNMRTDEGESFAKIMKFIEDNSGEKIVEQTVTDPNDELYIDERRSDLEHTIKFERGPKYILLKFVTLKKNFSILFY